MAAFIAVTTKSIYSMQKQPNCIKRAQPSKSLGEKSCEIKGGGHDMVAMMWMIMKLVLIMALFINYHQHHKH